MFISVFIVDFISFLTSLVVHPTTKTTGFSFDIVQMSKAPRDMCLCCGNAKFIACQQCNGSRKSTIRHFKFNSIALRCIKCDKNDGLVQCPICCARAKSPSCVLRSIDERSSVEINNNQTDNIIKYDL